MKTETSIRPLALAGAAFALLAALPAAFASGNNPTPSLVASAAYTDIADTTMIAPGQGTAFSSFGRPASSGGNVAFQGLYNSNQGEGVYMGVAGTTGATLIADTSMTPPGQTTAFIGLSEPVISGGSVVFQGRYNSGNDYGLYTGGAGTTGVTRIADTSMTAPGQTTAFSVIGNPDISGGIVAFGAAYNGGNGSGIYTGVAGTTGATRIVDTSMTAPGQTTAFSTFRLATPSGSNLAFFGYYNANRGQGIYTAVAGTTGATRVTDTSMTAPGQTTAFSAFGFSPDNSGGNLVFQGSYNTNSGQGIYTAVAGTTGVTRIADTSMTAPGQTTAFSRFGVYPRISGGNVAFLGSYNSGNGQGIYTGVAGTTGATRIADTSMNAPGQTTAFTSFGVVEISGANIAFSGVFNSGTSEGIFLSQGGNLLDVAETGEPLFGSIITSVNFGALNANYGGLSGNELAFDYTLANGVSGVATFVIPEPSTWALLGLGGASLLGLTLRQRRQRAA